MTREDTEWAGICQSNAVPTISRTQLREGKGLKATSWFPVQKERRELGLISEAQRGGRESFPLSLSWVIQRIISLLARLCINLLTTFAGKFSQCRRNSSIQKKVSQEAENKKEALKRERENVNIKIKEEKDSRQRKEVGVKKI